MLSLATQSFAHADMPLLESVDHEMTGQGASGLDFNRPSDSVEDVQARLFSKLGVRNRSGALAVADALCLRLLRCRPPSPGGLTSPRGYSSVSGNDRKY
jgi:hypothetical protein